MSYNVPVLVVSCDRYSDLWKPFFTLFWRHWPDCPYPVYLGTNHATFDDPRVTTVPIGDDISWAYGVMAMLDRIDAEHVLLLLEDFFLLEPVDTGRVQRLVDKAIESDVGCLRLYSIFPPPRQRPDSVDLGWFAPGDDYAVTAQGSLWKTSTLRKLLEPGFNVWEFELLGNKLRDYMPDAFWGVYEPALIYEQVVEKGRWRPEGLEICHAAGIIPDLSARGVHTRAELQAHYEAVRPGSQRADVVRRTLALLREGKRGAGIRSAANGVMRDPLSGRLWAALVASALGSTITEWLLRRRLQWTVRRMNRRVERASRAEVAEPAGSNVRN